jgi:DNA-binding transcriptional LysR family regulator
MMCEQGMGITPAAEFAAAKLLAEGRLVRILPHCVFPSSFIYVLYTGERHLSLRVKRMIEFLRLNMQSSISNAALLI